MPHSKGTDPLKFRLLLIQSLTEKQRSAVPHPVYGRPSTKLPPNRLTECCFLKRIPATGKKVKPQRCVMCSKHGKQKQFIDAANAKQACVWMGVPRTIT
jgi:hypothetical protein